LKHLVQDHGAPLWPEKKYAQADADCDLAEWFNAYYPRMPIGTKVNQWTLTREAFRLRREAREISN